MDTDSSSVAWIIIAFTLLRIVDSNWGSIATELPTRYLPPGSLRMLHCQFPGKVSFLGSFYFNDIQSEQLMIVGMMIKLQREKSQQQGIHKLPDWGILILFADTRSGQTWLALHPPQTFLAATIAKATRMLFMMQVNLANNVWQVPSKFLNHNI